MVALFVCRQVPSEKKKIKRQTMRGCRFFAYAFMKSKGLFLCLLNNILFFGFLSLFNILFFGFLSLFNILSFSLLSNLSNSSGILSSRNRLSSRLSKNCVAGGNSEQSGGEQ